MSENTPAPDTSTVQSSIKSFADRMKAFEKKHKWAVCPNCREEWTKLKLCRFFWNGQWTEDSLCVQCAETMKTIDKIQRRYPIQEFAVETGFHGPKSCGTETIWRNSYTQLTFGKLMVVLTCTDWGGPVVNVPEEEPLRTGNILFAWSVCQMVLDRHCDPKWNKRLLYDVKFGKTEEI